MPASHRDPLPSFLEEEPAARCFGVPRRRQYSVVSVEKHTRTYFENVVTQRIRNGVLGRGGGGLSKQAARQKGLNKINKYAL